MKLASIITVIVLTGITSLSFASEKDINQKALFEKLKIGEVVAVMRHALAPGNGDPSNFVLGQCETQRNLSLEGRNQANRIGDLFRQYGVTNAHIFSSQWCRCIDTATGLKLGATNELATLNSFFQRYENKSKQTEQLKNWLKKKQGTASLVLVTHQVNITALTDIFPSSGEIVFIRIEPSGMIIVEGSIRT